MNQLHEEIRQTMLALNQENAHPVVEELQCHLGKLFDMVRNELQQRLKGRSWSEPSVGIAEQPEAPYKSVRIDCGYKQPLTVEELKAGGWWCADVSEDCANAMMGKGLDLANDEWGGNIGNEGDACILSGLSGSVVTRVFSESYINYLKQIHRINDQFFWSDEK